MENILENAKTAFQKERALCQDTGQVIVFVEMGQNVQLKGDFINDVINNAVAQCYKENFFRKSTVENAVFERKNTNTNTPCIIHTKLIKGDEIKLKVLIKGAGSENKSKLQMLLPNLNEDEIIKIASKLILEAGKSACPPMFIGIGIGKTSEGALMMSKEALLEENFTDNEIKLAQKIKETANNQAPKDLNNIYALDVKVKTDFTHIACMPLAVSINCHSDRYKSCTISENGVSYTSKTPEFIEIVQENNRHEKEIYTDDVDKIRQLKKGEELLLTGEIYTARDMAHKRLYDIIQNGDTLPFDIKNKIIFYAGPCPEKPNEIIGSIGPTTASRMDMYCEKLFDLGLLGTIGKGERSIEAVNIIKNNKGRYFTMQGGIAALLADKVKSSTIIAFEDLGPEAIYKLYVEKFPVIVEI